MAKIKARRYCGYLIYKSKIIRKDMFSIVTPDGKFLDKWFKSKQNVKKFVDELIKKEEKLSQRKPHTTYDDYETRLARMRAEGKIYQVVNGKKVYQPKGERWFDWEGTIGTITFSKEWDK